MVKKIALLFAGQGAQSVGMGRDLTEQFPTAAGLFQKADDVLGRKLSEIAWHGPIEELTKTSNCQPALFVHGLVCLSILRELVIRAGVETYIYHVVCQDTSSSRSGTIVRQAWVAAGGGAKRAPTDVLPAPPRSPWSARATAARCWSRSPR